MFKNWYNSTTTHLLLDHPDYYYYYYYYYYYANTPFIRLSFYWTIQMYDWNLIPKFMTSLLYICLNTLLHIYHLTVSHFFNNWNIMPLGLSTFCIITYVFLFLVRLRFPAQVSVIKILRRPYGDESPEIWEV